MHDPGAKTRVSILFATFKRPQLLRQTLASLTRQQLDGFSLSVFVVDNDPHQGARAIVEEFGSTLNVTYLAEPKPGKSAALNTGLATLRDFDLLVLTDDDIVADPRWIAELSGAMQRWPHADIFGGRILPRFPEQKTVDVSNPWVRVVLAVQDEDGPEREVPSGKLWGANLAIRARALRDGVRFNESIGPAGEQYATGCEVDFTRRLENEGARCVFVPTAIVEHVIREEQLSEEWMCRRAYKQGRGEAVRNVIGSEPVWFGVPRWIYRRRLEVLLQRVRHRIERDARGLLESRMEAEFLAGLSFQYRLQSRSRPGA